MALTNNTHPKNDPLDNPQRTRPHTRPKLLKIQEENGRRKIDVPESLSVLDRYPTIWIILAMIVGFLLDYNASYIASTIQAGRFVGVRISVGKHLLLPES